jgi:hypothetical protein
MCSAMISRATSASPLAIARSRSSCSCTRAHRCGRRPSTRCQIPVTGSDIARASPPGTGCRRRNRARTARGSRHPCSHSVRPADPGSRARARQRPGIREPQLAAGRTAINAFVIDPPARSTRPLRAFGPGGGTSHSGTLSATARRFVAVIRPRLIQRRDTRRHGSLETRGVPPARCPRRPWRRCRHRRAEACHMRSGLHGPGRRRDP